MKLNIENFLEYIAADIKMRNQKMVFLTFVKDPISRFHFYYRFLELMQGRWFVFPFFIIIKFLFLRLSIRLGFSIPINTLGKGVHIPHYGTIVVNEKSFIGDFSVINVGVVIGRHPSSKDKVPRIGRCVYLAPGVKVFGDIFIADNSVIGANCVVTKSVEENSLCLGIPGRVVGVVPEEFKQCYIRR